MILGQGEYEQTVKNQAEDVPDAHLRPALQGQPPSKPGSHLHFYLSLYFQPISLQQEAGSEPHSDDADESVTPAEGPWQRDATLQAPNRKHLFLSKLTLAPATFLYLSTTIFTATMSSWQETKTVMSSANTEIFARTLLVREIPSRAGWVLSSLSIQSRGSKART